MQACRLKTSSGCAHKRQTEALNKHTQKLTIRYDNSICVSSNTNNNNRLQYAINKMYILETFLMPKRRESRLLTLTQRSNCSLAYPGFSIFNIKCAGARRTRQFRAVPREQMYAIVICAAASVSIRYHYRKRTRATLTAWNTPWIRHRQCAQEGK